MIQERKSAEQQYILEEEAFLHERRVISECEEVLFQQKAEAIRSLEEVGDRANVYLRNFLEDPSDLYQAFHMVEVAKAEAASICQKEQLNLEYRMEKAEQKHQKNQFRYQQELLDSGNEASC